MVDNIEMFVLLLRSAHKGPRPLLLFILPPTTQRAGRGCTRSWKGKGTLPRQPTPTDHTDIPDHMASWSGGEEGGNRRGHLQWRPWSSRVTVMCHEALVSWRWLSTCLSLGSGEWISCFALLVCTGFALRIKLSLSHPKSLLSLTLLIHHVRVSGFVGLSCQLGLNNRKKQYFSPPQVYKYGNREDISFLP